MKIELKTGTRKMKHTDKFGQVGERSRPVVEMWVGGFCFVHECETLDQATKIVIRLSWEMGLEK